MFRREVELANSLFLSILPESSSFPSEVSFVPCASAQKKKSNSNNFHHDK
jgi:hypothetical protein